MENKNDFILNNNLTIYKELRSIYSFLLILIVMFSKIHIQLIE